MKKFKYMYNILMHKNENHLYLNKTAIKNPICKAGKKIN